MSTPDSLPSLLVGYPTVLKTGNGTEAGRIMLKKGESSVDGAGYIEVGYMLQIVADCRRIQLK